MKNQPENLKYAKSHEWSKLEDGNLVRVGITDFAQEELGDLVYIELPEIGKSYQAGQQCAVVESVKTASDLYAPVTGNIVEVNESLLDTPEQVNDAAYDTWLFCIKADSIAELEKLMTLSEYLNMVESD